MQIDAAVVRDRNQPAVISRISLETCRSDELVVEVYAVGICHTDIAVRDGFIPSFKWPAVLGHEGAGRVMHVGSDVAEIAVGDHVVLSFASCGDCEPCLRDSPANCVRFASENIGGCRSDGSVTHHDGNGPIHGCFFGQSSFATHALVRARNVVKVPDDLPLELLGPLGCGLMTGAGTVMNFIKPAIGSSLAIFGCGAVGLAAVMAAKAARCGRIIVVDIIEERLDLALELGATDVINARQIDPVKAIRAIVPAGADAIVEASGSVDAMVAALGAIAAQGLLVPVGMIKPETVISIPLHQLKTARIQAVTMGNAVPRTFIPELIEMYRAGQFPFERLVKFYDFENINVAIEDADFGRVIKPILLVSDDARAAHRA